MKRFSHTFQTLKNSKFFRKILFSFIFTFSVIFFIFFTLIMGFLSNKYKEDRIRTNDQMIAHSEEIADSLLKSIHTNSSVLFTGNQTVMNLMYGNTWDDSREIRAVDMVDSIQNSSTYIHSVYLINYALEKVMTNFQFYSTEDFYDQELLQLLQDTAPSSTAFFFLPRTVNRYASYSNIDKPSERIWSLIYYSSRAGAMVINIDSDAFSRLLDLSADNGDSFYLLNNNQQVLYSSDDTLYSTRFSDPKILSKISSASAKSGHFVAEQDNRKYTVSFSKDSSIGLISIKMDPYTLFDSAESLLGISLLTSVFYILLSLLLAFLVTSFLYKPVDLLKNSVLAELPELPDKKSADEFSMLTSAYHSIILKNHRLEKYVDACLSLSQERELTRFLQGSADAIAPDAYAELSLLFPENYFCILLIELDTQKQDNGTLTGTPNDISLVMFSISNVADELLSSACAFRRMETSYSRLTYILNLKDSSLAPLKGLLNQLHDLINTHFHVSFSIGTSSVVNEMDALPLALREAENSLSQRFVYGFNHIHIYSEQDIPSTESLLYPFDIESELLLALKNLNSEKTREALDSFFNRISTYPYSQIHLYLLWLNYNIQRMEYQNQTDLEPVNLDTAYTLSEIHDLLEHHCMSLIQFLSDKKSSGSERKDLLNTLEELIEKNLCNPNLSVIYLAAEVHLSVNYLRSIYKEQTGESLSAYIAAKKMELIYDLLLNTNLNIQEISDKLGFSTKNYFFTFFKKHAGITPSQYRNLHRKS